MALFSIEIADEDVTRVLTAIASNYSRPDQVENPAFDEESEEDENNTRMIDNPETIYQFTNRIVRQFLQEHVAAHEAKVAKQAAIDALNTSVEINDPQV